jgi:hypothetical protein
MSGFFKTLLTSTQFNQKRDVHLIANGQSTRHTHVLDALPEVKAQTGQSKELLNLTPKKYHTQQ